MDQNDKQNTSSQTPGGDLPPLSGTGVDVKAPEKASEKVPADSGPPVKPEVVKPEVANVPMTPDETGGGLPPLETAEDETFNPEVVSKEKNEEKIKKVDEVGEKTLPPLPDSGADEGLKEIKEMGEINNESQETPPPPPPEETPVAPGKMEEKPLTTEGIDMDDGGKGKKKGKKKINKKTIVGGLIALVLLVGVPVLALNLDYFRGDVRERAYLFEDPTPILITGTPTIECLSDYQCSDGYECKNQKCVKYECSSDYQCSDGYECKNHKCVKEKTAPTDVCIIDGNTCGGEGLPDKSCCTPTFVCAVVDEYTGIKKCVSGGSTPTPGDSCGPELVCDPSLGTGGTNCLNAGGSPEGCTDKNGRVGYCCVPVEGPSPTSTIRPTSTLTPTKTPTKKPTVGICVAIKIYTLQESVWVETPVAEVGQHASVGDTIRLTLKGNSSAFVRGRFRVVGGVSSDWIATEKKNGNGELYIDYQLENGGSYSVEGEIRK